MTSPRRDDAGRHPGEDGKAQNNQARFSYPSAHSVKGRVLGALLRGERLTHLDCWRRFGSARLSHHIYILRNIGWSVDIVEQAVPTSDAARRAFIGIYSLPCGVVAEAGDLGQQYAAEAARIESDRRAA
jgi:hypothetical protein